MLELVKTRASSPGKTMFFFEKTRETQGVFRSQKFQRTYVLVWCKFDNKSPHSYKLEIMLKTIFQVSEP